MEATQTAGELSRTTEAIPEKPVFERKLPPIALGATRDKIPPALVKRVSMALFEPKWPLLLWGPTGTGKTCLAALIYKHRPKGESVAWFSTRTLLRELAQARATGETAAKVSLLTQRGEPSHAEAGSVWHQIENANLLVLDDLGTRDRLSPAQSELLIDILDARQGKPTIITTNLDREALGKVLDGRIVSRLFRGHAVECSGVDQRLQEGVDFGPEKKR